MVSARFLEAIGTQALDTVRSGDVFPFGLTLVLVAVVHPSLLGYTAREVPSVTVGRAPPGQQ